MMKILGYLLIALGFTGFIFFKNYRGDTIPEPIVWIIASFILLGLGVYFISIGNIKKQKRDSANLLNALKKLKENGEQIKIDLDYCDFKTNNYSEELRNESFSSAQMYDFLYHPNRKVKTQSTNQTVIIYTNHTANAEEKFVSQTFSIDITNLKYHIMNGDIKLYVDQLDRKNYFFDIAK